jgi:hypothetical protein
MVIKIIDTPSHTTTIALLFFREIAIIGASSEYSKRYSPNSRETHTREEFTTPLCLRVLTTTTTTTTTTTAYDHHNIIIIRTVDNDATQIRDNLANNTNGLMTI